MPGASAMYRLMGIRMARVPRNHSMGNTIFTETCVSLVLPKIILGHHLFLQYILVIAIWNLLVTFSFSLLDSG